jgi:hypothetical protein
MMMKQYPRLKNILTSVFSIDVGLSESQEKAALNTAASNEEWKAAIKEELLGLLSDSEISLIEFLENDEYEAYPADDEEEAKEFIITRIWDVLFPGEQTK